MNGLLLNIYSFGLYSRMNFETVLGG